MKKALVIGSVGLEEHEETVRNYFLTQAPSWTCHIAEEGTGVPAGNIVTYQEDIAGCVAYAIEHGYDMIIRSYEGIWANRFEWDIAYVNGIAIVHAHGGNIHIEKSEPPELFSSVTCGGGVTENERSYGSGLEFFDSVPQGWTLDHEWNRTVESYATPIIAGKIANVFDALSCSMWEARYRARSAGSKNGVWDNHDGYGIIDVSAAIAYGGGIPSDPYPIIPFESKQFAGMRFGN